MEGDWGTKDEHYEADFAGVNALADGIKTNGAMKKLTISGDPYKDDGNWKNAPAVTVEASMVEADFSGKHLGASGAIMLAAFLPKFLVLTSSFSFSCSFSFSPLPSLLLLLSMGGAPLCMHDEIC